MPKVKDLGVTVVPEQFGPVGIGGGGGCYPYTFCTDCTNVPFSICGTTPQTAQRAAVGAVVVAMAHAWKSAVSAGGADDYYVGGHR